MTSVLDAPVEPVAAAWPSPPRSARVVLAALIAASVALLGMAALAAAPSTVRIEPIRPAFAGSAPQVTLPTYGLQGMHVLGYEHGATTRITLPVRNDGRLPITVTSVRLGGGIAPLLEVRKVDGLPLSVGPGETSSFEVTAELANCRFFHEREIQNYPSVELGFTVLGREGSRTVPYDRPVMVHSPMIVGCPERKLNRQADDRTDLEQAG